MFGENPPKNIRAMTHHFDEHFLLSFAGCRQKFHECLTECFPWAIFIKLIICMSFFTEITEEDVGQGTKYIIWNPDVREGEEAHYTIVYYTFVCMIRIALEVLLSGL